MALQNWRKQIHDHGRQLLSYAEEKRHPELAAKAGLYFTFAGSKDSAKEAVSKAVKLSRSPRATHLLPIGFLTHFEKRFDEVYLALHELLRHDAVVAALRKMHGSKPTKQSKVEAMELAHFRSALREAWTVSRVISRRRAPKGSRARPRKLPDLMPFYINWLKDPVAEKVTSTFFEQEMSGVRAAFKEHLLTQNVPEGVAEVLARGLIGPLRNESVVGHHAYLLHALSLLEELLPPGREQPND